MFSCEVCVVCYTQMRRRRGFFIETCFVVLERQAHCALLINGYLSSLLLF